MALPMSTKYPAKVFFFTSDPQALLDAGYDSLRIEKRKDRLSPWTTVTAASDAASVRLAAGVWNYHYVVAEADTQAEFRAVLQNSASPGSPVDIPQPPVRAVDTSYESIMTVQEFREIYLWGQDPAFIADDGRQQPEYTYVHNIKYGIAKVERKLGLRLLPTKIVEAHDWMDDGGMARDEWLSFFLDEYPVLRLESVKLKLPGATSDYAYPESWCRLQKDTGQLMIVPDGSGAAPMPLGAMLTRRKMVPDAFEITYFAGFDPGAFPIELKEVVGKEGAFGPLNVGGDLVGGAGLAGSSLSLDGLSQSITTTNSSTNAGFGARLIQYEKELKETYKTLLPYYRGPRMRVA